MSSPGYTHRYCRFWMFSGHRWHRWTFCDRPVLCVASDSSDTVRHWPFAIWQMSSQTDLAGDALCLHKSWLRMWRWNVEYVWICRYQCDIFWNTGNTGITLKLALEIKGQPKAATLFCLVSCSCLPVFFWHSDCIVLPQVIPCCTCF